MNKKAIFNNWSFPRMLRLAVGAVILYQAVYTKDILFGVAGLLFASMAIFNFACCGNNGCAVPVKKNADTPKDISHEEVV